MASKNYNEVTSSETNPSAHTIEKLKGVVVEVANQRGIILDFTSSKSLPNGVRFWADFLLSLLKKPAILTDNSALMNLSSCSNKQHFNSESGALIAQIGTLLLAESFNGTSFFEEIRKSIEGGAGPRINVMDREVVFNIVNARITVDILPKIWTCFYVCQTPGCYTVFPTEREFCTFCKKKHTSENGSSFQSNVC